MGIRACLSRLLPEEPEDIRGFFASLPPLETERLLLRPVRRGDAADFYAYASDPEVARHVLWRAHRSLSETRAVIRMIRRQYWNAEPSLYAIVLRSSGRMIGTIGFNAWDEEHLSAEVGYSLAREFWHQGLATEALQALLGLCFDRMGLHRVEGMHELDNPASGRVMEHCGMRREGVLRGRIRNKGAWKDVCLYAILAEEWVSASPAG